jgi:NACHT domain
MEKKSISMANQKAARLEAEAKSQAKSRTPYVAATAAVTAGTVLWLGASYLYRDFRPVLLWRVKRGLLRYRGWEALTRAKQLQVSAQEPFLVPAHVGTMLLGPAGCGKSTLLQHLASDAAQRKIPTALVRLNYGDEKGRVDPSRSLRELMTRVCTAIDYPTQSSLLGSILRENSASSSTKVSADLAPARRLEDALSTLFVAAEQLYEKRSKTMDAAVARPLLLFDGVHDVLKSGRSGAAGGKEVFRRLATLLTDGCCDNKFVRAVVTGSSRDLDTAFSKTSMSGPSCWHYLELADPDEAAVREKLQNESGYTKEEASRLIDAFGTRPRLLTLPFHLGREKLDVDAFIDQQMEIAAEEIQSLLKNVPQAEEALHALKAGKSVHIDTLPPSAVVCPYFSMVFFLQQDGYLRFQNKLMENAWAQWGAREEGDESR